MRYFLFLLIIILFIGCSGNSKKKEDISQVHIPSKVEGYFYSNLPDWANFVESASCMRNDRIRFLNFPTLKKSFDLSYEELVQLQLKVNEKLVEGQDNFRQASLAPGMEEKIFFEAKEQVESKIATFHVPNFKRVHLVWVDPLLASESYDKKLRSLLKSEDFFKGHPVFISLCLNRKGVKKLIADYNWTDIDIKIISSEMFAPFNIQGEFRPNFQLDLSNFLKGKEVYLYNINGQLMNNIIGPYQVKNY